MKKIVVIILVILGVTTFAPVLSSAAVVWSYDFTDGNYTGWTVINGTYSAEDQVLRAASADDYCSISHESSVAYGNWSFDVYHNASVNPLYFDIYSFIADELVDGPYTTTYLHQKVPLNGYTLEFGILGASVRRWTDGDGLTIGAVGGLTFSGWRTVEINRDSAGHFAIYVNGTLVEELDDATFTTSELFGWSSKPGHAIDNVIVNELEPTALAIDPLLLGTGVAIAVGFIAIVVYIRRR